MPSTTSSSLASDLPSSTVITPSLPTLSIASAMILPTSSSLFAEIVPTWAISLLVVVGFDCFFSSSTNTVTALSMPRFRSIGFMPAATYFMPSRTMACASTVAVVVPSPAMSEVLEATSLTICAPMFWSLSLSSISFATDTPSLVTVGPPNERSSTTLRPFGPSVTLTALARMLTPSTMRARASPPNETSFAAILSSPEPLLLDHGEEVFLAHHQQFVAVDLDGLAAVLAEQNPVAGLDIHRDDVATLAALARSYRQDFTLIGLFRDVVGNDDSGSGLGFLLHALDDHAIGEGTKFHGISFWGSGLLTEDSRRPRRGMFD